MSKRISLREHLEMQLRFERELREANDRRYSDVSSEREKALKIKEAADEKALDLASQIQTYKDEKANELREQISRERGAYVSQDQFKPVADFVTSQQGGSKVWNAVVGISLTVAGFVIAWLLRGGGV